MHQQSTMCTKNTISISYISNYHGPFLLKTEYKIIRKYRKVSLVLAAIIQSVKCFYMSHKQIGEFHAPYKTKLVIVPNSIFFTCVIYITDCLWEANCSCFSDNFLCSDNESHCTFINLQQYTSMKKVLFFKTSPQLSIGIYNHNLL